MLKKIISGIMVIAVCLVGLSGCGQENSADIVMPEIVFAAYNWSPSETEYETGTFIGVSGSLIDSNGNIKYFEFEETNEPYYNYDEESITMEMYSELRNMSEFHKKAVENSVDTYKYSAVSKEDLQEYYGMLEKIDTDTEMLCQGTLFPGINGLYCVYGVRINENNDVEYSPLMEIGDNYYKTENNYAEKLYEKLCNETELERALAGNENKYV